MHRIAFVTYKKDPALSGDDQLVTRYLELKGIFWKAVPWNEQNINWKNIDAVILRSCWDYYLHYEEFIQWLRYLATNKIKVYNDVKNILWNSDKIYLKDIFDKGFLLPDSVILGKNQSVDLYQLLNEKNWSKAVIKPVVSAGAFETWLVDRDNVSEYQKRLNIFLPERAFLIQEYMEEIATEGEVSLVFFNKKYSHAVLKRPRRNDFRVQLKFGGTVEPLYPSRKIVQTAQKIIDLFDQNLLYARVDGIPCGDDFYLMELELIEPNLYLTYHDKAPELFADAIYDILKNNR